MTGPRISRLTGPGVSAVAVFALEGPGAIEIIRGLFRRRDDKPLPAHWGGGRALFGSFGGPPGDEVLVVARNPESFEVHAHGGERLTRWLVGLCVERGAIDGGANSYPGFADVRAAGLLAHAPTRRTAEILLGLANGAWQRAEREFFALIAAGDLDAAEVMLGRWDALRPAARHLVEPFIVAILGEPNAGKSSLLNRLIGFERAVVSPLPGTTRDLVTADTAIEGWPVRLIDTAGLREGGEDLETEGMELAREQARSADLVLWLHDRTRPARPPDCAATEILTKADLPPHPDWVDCQLPAVSATTGERIDELLGLIRSRLIAAEPDVGEGFPPTEADYLRMESLLSEAGGGA